ncbi:DUF6090 family protein [Robiginitalea sp. IMCC44478]|uniref:DUF6090 family protein n=1 Tax=Robiginitalea sp. IMCC44478 TaxID=3459122 RepID=UPI0040414D85
MLSYLRHIRQKLLEENRLNKYILYVIIEVFIVIIGILIAIQVDNWNEERSGAEKNKLLFKEVYDELLQNIQNTDRIIDLYIEKDSLYFYLFNGFADYEDYKKYPRLFHFAFMDDMTTLINPLGYERTGLVDEDYKELITGKDKLTRLQDSILSELKDLYGKIKSNVDTDDETIYRSQLSLRDKMMERQPWWSHYVNFKDISDEMIQFALNDTFFHNQLSELCYREQSHMRGLLAFRVKALNLYEKIAEMLQLETDSSLIPDIADFEHVKGVYRRGQTSFDITGKKELRTKLYDNDSLMGPGAKVYPYHRSHLIIHRDDKKDDNWLAKIEYGKDGEVLGLSWFANLLVEEGTTRKYIQPKIE